MQHHAQIVIGRDGTILAATGQLPPGLLDTRLDNCDQLPPSVRAAGTAALQQLRVTGDRIVSQTVVLDEESVQILAIEAIAIRQSATNVQELLTSKLDVLASQADAQGVTLSVKVAEDVPVVHLDSEKVA